MYRTKISALGGVGSDKPFEQAVADLAHDFLMDKAPTLMKSELGFQMLDKSDDDSKGVGVCVFQPNDILMFVPIFFLNGEIKGHELLYLPDQDLFVPLKEPWVNELIGKKPAKVGDSVEKNFITRQGGVQPDLSMFRTPPKFASYINPYLLRKVANFVPKLKRYIEHTGLNFSKTASLMIKSGEALKEVTDIRQFLKYASARGLKKLNKMIQGSKLTKRAFNEMYPNLKIDDYINYKIKDARSRYLLRREPNPNWREEMYPTKDAGYVSIISYSATIANGSDIDLSEKEKEKLAKQQYLVIDTRPDSKVSVVVSEPKEYSNPDGSGVYSVLMANGTFKDLVLVKQDELDDHKAPTTITSEYIVCEEDDTKGYTHPGSAIFVKEKYPHDRFVKWYNKLHDADDYSYLRNKGYVSFLNEKGSCYGHIPTWGLCQGEGIIRIVPDCAAEVEVEIGNKWTTVLKKRGRRLYVPTDCKVLESDYIDVDDVKHLFGTPDIVKYAARKDTQTIKLATTSSDHCVINGKTYPTKYAGFCALIKDYNLREKTAKDLFKKAEVGHNGYHVASILVKKAEGMGEDELNRRPESSMFFPEAPDGEAAIFGDMVYAQPNSMMMVAPEDNGLQPNTGPYENTLNEPYPMDNMAQVQQALQSGQDEVFNLSVLKQFLNDGDLSTEIDKEIPELIKGMNHAGQMLFRYYWKGEKFKELYGPQEMPELESSLRNIFELMGDVILLLKHRVKKDDTYGELSKINLSNIDE